MGNETIKKRRSNFELLRIVAMFLIVCHHYSVHGEFDVSSMSFANRMLINFLAIGGKFGVNVFVLISGYFLVKSEFSIKKIIKLILDITIFSVLIFLVFICIDINNFDIKYLIHTILPVPYLVWWFASVYVVLYCLSPFINKLVFVLQKKQLDILILLLAVILSVVPTFLHTTWVLSDLAWFIFLYLIAARLRVYPLTHKFFDKSIIWGVLLYIGIIISSFLIDLIASRLPVFAGRSTYFADMEKLPMLLCSVFVFIGFSKIYIGNNKIINTIAASTFGIYLLHDHEFLRGALWKTLFKNASYQTSSYLFLHAIITISITFIVCMIISVIYNYTIGIITDKISRSLDSSINKRFLQKSNNINDNVESNS